MVNKQPLFIGLVSGIISGLILGLFLKGVQLVTHHNVYTLLLNVDFIPILGDIVWPEYIEFIFHLIISIIIGIVYSQLQLTKTHPYITSFIITIPTIPLFYVLIHLSIKKTVAITDEFAFLWWTIGHLLFSLSLSISYLFIHKKMTS